MSPVSVPVMMELGLAMLEGSLKYGRHNYRRAGVRASVYYDALMRHIGAWWEGEDMDPGTKGRIHHITKCISTLTVLRDSMIQGNWVDDRPPKTPQGFVDEYNRIAASLIEEVGEPKQAYTECEPSLSTPKPLAWTSEVDAVHSTSAPVTQKECASAGDSPSTLSQEKFRSLTPIDEMFWTL
jgi:hypothetical protein